MNRPRGRTYGLYLADLSHENTQSHGIVNYATGLAESIPDVLEGDERLVLFVNAQLAKALQTTTSNVDLCLVPRPERPIDRLVDDHIRSLRWARDASVDVLHYPKGFVPLRWRKPPAVVATVHDDIPRHYRAGTWGTPDRSPKTAYFSWAIGHAVRHADEVLTVSDFSRRQLEALGRRTALPRITVTGQGTAVAQSDPVPLDRRGSYLFHFASTLPHKQSAELVRRTLRWLDTEAGAGLTLRVLGQLPDEVLHLADHPKLQWIRRWLTDAEVAHELRSARALLFPSFYEGFGRPPVEALLQRTPVVYAQVGAADEVLAGVPGGYPPGDDEAFERALATALAMDGVAISDAARRLQVRHRWSDVAARTVEVYRRLAAQR